MEYESVIGNGYINRNVIARTTVMKIEVENITGKVRMKKMISNDR